MVNPPIELGTLGMSDTLILMVLALVVFGPRRLPQIARQLGKLMYEFRKASNDFKFQMEEELRLSEEADRRKKEEAERARNLALNPPAQTSESQAASGGQESVSAPSHPLYGSGYPEPNQMETAAAAQDEPPPTVPRIQPPSTGAPVPAERQGTVVQGPEVQGPRDQGNEAASAVAAEEAASAETKIGAAAPVTAAPEGARAESGSQPDAASSEIVSQHG